MHFSLFQILLRAHRHDFPHVAGVRSFTAKPTRLQTPANTPPDPCREDLARPLQTRRRCQTGAAMSACTTARTPLSATTLRSAPPADKPVKPLQTRRCQTPADKTLPDPCRRDAARPLQTRRCCQTGAAMSACTTARTPLPATQRHRQVSPERTESPCLLPTFYMYHKRYFCAGLVVKVRYRLVYGIKSEVLLIAVYSISLLIVIICYAETFDIKVYQVL